jgi:hypothetical protein
LTQKHSWDAKRQRWKIDRAETAIVLGTVGVFASLLALALLFAR